MYTPITTISEVDKFVRDNIFLIAQRKYRWIYLDSETPTEIILFTKFIEYAFKSIANWKKRVSKKQRRPWVNHFNCAIRNWLVKYYPSRSEFVYGEEVLYEEDLCSNASSQGIQPVACACKDNCATACPNRWLEVECDSKCQSGSSCTNKEAQTPFDWQTIIDARYISKEIGVGLFAKTDIQEGTYLGHVAGFALTAAKTAKAIADGEGRYLFSWRELGTSFVRTINTHKYGNHTRFLNHSSAPNTQPQQWLSVGRMVIKFYAQRLIRKVSE